MAWYLIVSIPDLGLPHIFDNRVQLILFKISGGQRMLWQTSIDVQACFRRRRMTNTILKAIHIITLHINIDRFSMADKFLTALRPNIKQTKHKPIVYVFCILQKVILLITLKNRGISIQCRTWPRGYKIKRNDWLLADTCSQAFFLPLRLYPVGDIRRVIRNTKCLGG